jgi:hypothetical protein
LVGSSILSPGTIKIKALARRGFVQKTGQIQRASESNEQGADANGERLTQTELPSSEVVNLLEPLSHPVHIVSVLRTGAPLKLNSSRHEAPPDEDLQDQRLQPNEGYEDRTYCFEDLAKDQHEGVPPG